MEFDKKRPYRSGDFKVYEVFAATNLEGLLYSDPEVPYDRCIVFKVKYMHE